MNKKLKKSKVNHKMKIKTTIDGAEVIDIAEVSRITGYYNLNKLYELLRYKLFPEPIKIKNKNFWKRSEIEEYLAKAKKEKKMREAMIQMNELLKLFKVSRVTIYEWIRRDFPKPIKIGHKNFWKRSEIEEYLAKAKKEKKKTSIM